MSRGQVGFCCLSANRAIENTNNSELNGIEVPLKAVERITQK